MWKRFFIIILFGIATAHIDTRTIEWRMKRDQMFKCSEGISGLDIPPGVVPCPVGPMCETLQK